MKAFVAKVSRFVKLIISQFQNSYRKTTLRLMYPGLSIDKLSTIQSGCEITCIDGGILTIVNSHIKTGVHITADEHARVTLTNCSIGSFSHIVSKQQITINNGVAIAEMVVVRDQDHAIDKVQKQPSSKEYNVAPIVIGANTWIASKATILKGVTIGEDCIIAASSVVNKSIPSKEVWGGIPAKFIKTVS